MKVSKSIITAINTECSLEESGLVDHANEISQQIERNVRSCDEKIARGRQHASQIPVF